MFLRRWIVKLQGAALILGAIAVLPGLSAWAARPAVAREFYLGEAVERNGIRIVPNYLTDSRLDGIRSRKAGGPNSIELETDIHATRQENHGFAPDAWMPYLRIHYRLTHAGTGFVRQGWFFPATSKDGPYYGTTLNMDGNGTYHLTLLIFPPPADALLRQVNTGTGVPSWWRPFSQTWIFTYPSKPK